MTGKGGRFHRRAKTPAGSCFWFTGPSGTGIRQALRSIKNEFLKVGREVEIVSIEDELLPAYAKYNRPTNGSKREAILQELRKPGGFKQILDEAPSLVQGLWPMAAATAGKKISSLLRRADVFLTFHASYHSDKFGDFYSPVEARALQKMTPPKKFLCLIDDIGDAAAQLRKEGQVFANRSKTGLDSVIHAVRDLLTVLEWRASEITLSRLLGNLVGADVFLLAVKHPAATATRLLLNKGIAAYISHPISEPRRIFERTGDWPPVMQEVQRFTNKFIEGQANTDIIPIVPTSIDERRIASQVLDNKTLLVPQLLPRWELPKGPLLSASNSDDPASKNWLDPCDHFGGLHAWPPTSAVRDELTAVTGLLSAVQTRIDNQINARDHILVAQCPHFIVYRPYVAWRMTGGVAAEIRHREHLKRLGQAGGDAIFCHRLGDDALRKLGKLVEQVALLFSWRRGDVEVKDGELKQLLQERLENQQPPSWLAQDLEKHVKQQLEEAGVAFDRPRSVGDNGVVLGKPTASDSEKRARELWAQISSDLKSVDSWKKSADEWLRKDFTPEQFADKLNELERHRSKRAA